MALLLRAEVAIQMAPVDDSESIVAAIGSVFGEVRRVLAVRDRDHGAIRQLRKRPPDTRYGLRRARYHPRGRALGAGRGGFS
jgi:hypothetical protein